MMTTSSAAATTSVPAAAFNRRIKRWPGWLALAVVVVAALAIGANRAGGPQTDDDRTDGITQRLACPECDGESVYESRSPAADTIRRQVKALVQQGQFGDDQIIEYIAGDAQFGARTLLVPRATGFDSLVWMLPVFAAVVALAGLAVAFRRWRHAADTVPTADDRALVDAALRAEDESEHDDADFSDQAEFDSPDQASTP